jgi:3-hydroxybutyryl-CoA dehydrogenase
MKLCNVGVVGAGVIGVGVAQAFAQTGHNVVLVDISQAILDRARTEIANGIRFSSLTEPGLRSSNHREILSRICFTTDYGKLADVDFIAENVTEDWGIKEAAYRLLDRYCSPQCIIAANTSAIPIARLAKLLSRPDILIGIHFMNPVPKKVHVELIPSRYTGKDTYATTLQILSQLGKKAILVKDHAGFVSNRVMMVMINEAIATLQDDVASAEDVDSVFVNCFAHKMGPLATADLIGLDTILRTLEVLHEHYQNPKYEPCPLLRNMVESGTVGRKSGRGFFNYNKSMLAANGY